MKRLLSTFLMFACLLMNSQVVFAQTTTESMPVISFANTSQFPSDTLISVPIYINTNGQKLDSLQVKIDIAGEVDALDAKISSQIPVQEINRVITDSSIFVTITSLDLGKNWSTQENTELLTLSFQHKGDGIVELAFDPENTVAASDVSEENVLQVGKNARISFGEVTPNLTTRQEETVTPTNTTPAVSEQMDQEKQDDNKEGLLIAVLIASLAAAGALLLYMLRKKATSTETGV